jgi:DNA-binding response OmpR family regulator
MVTNEDLKTILVIEPDVLVRMVICDYLRDCGYRVIEGVVGGDVWAVLEAGRRVDLVMIDVNAAAGGFSVASRIRQTRRDIDVILTSGVSAAVEECHDLCEEGPIKKPYEPRDVEARIKILLERRRAARKP